MRIDGIRSPKHPAVLFLFCPVLARVQYWTHPGLIASIKLLQAHHIDEPDALCRVHRSSREEHSFRLVARNQDQSLRMWYSYKVFSVTLGTGQLDVLALAVLMIKLTLISSFSKYERDRL